MAKDRLLGEYDEIAVMGAGTTGQAVVDYLVEKGVNVFVTEKTELDPEARNSFRRKGVEFEEGKHSKRLLNSDMVVLSPGVPASHELVRRGRSLGIPTIGEIELAYRLSPTDKIIAVTGTNGKSTTVNLINELLKFSGTSSTACGNIGTPFISEVPSLSPTDVAVVEVSSYQLETVQKFKPRVSVLTNLGPDHLKRHGSVEKYREVKLKIFSNQNELDYAVINEKLDLEVPNKKPTSVEFSPLEIPELELTAPQKENVGAALEAVNCLLGEGGLNSPPPEPISQGLNLPHRLETIGSERGIEFINDSKATNPDATRAAIDSFEKPIRLLLGGKAKKSGYKGLLQEIEPSSVRGIYLFGSAEERLAEMLKNNGISNFDTCQSLEEAVEEAFAEAEFGEAVLLSPGCASFDRFNNFEERGEKFKTIVNSLTKDSNLR